jgi:hypothetical protein
VAEPTNNSSSKSIEKQLAADTAKLTVHVARKVITPIEIGEIQTTSEVAIYMKLIVDEDGNVLEITSTSKTMCTDPVVLQQVLDAMRKVKFIPKPGTPREVVFYTVKIDNK